MGSHSKNVLTVKSIASKRAAKLRDGGGLYLVTRGDNEPVRVVGVTLQDEDDMDFIVIRTNEDGEMFAGLEQSLWKESAKVAV